MPWYLKQLMRRGYWEEAGGDGAAGGGPGGSGADDSEDGAADSKKKDDKSAGKDDKSDDKKGMTDAEAKLLKESLQRKQKLEELSKRFEGVDPEKYRKMLADEETRQSMQRKQEEDAALARGEFDRVKQSMSEQHKAQIDELSRKLAEKDSVLVGREKEVHELSIGNNFANSKFIPESMNIPISKMRALYGSHFEFKDGVVVAYDKPRGASDRTMLVDSSGDPIPFDAAIQKIVEADPDRDSMLKSKVKPGAGSGAAKVKAGAADEKPTVSGASRIAAALSKAKVAKK